MLADAAPAPVVARSPSHPRTILEVVGATLAVGRIVAAGAFGFVLGHVTAKHDGRGDGGRMTLSVERDGRGGPDMDGMWGQDSPPFVPSPGTAPTAPQG